MDALGRPFTYRAVVVNKKPAFQNPCRPAGAASLVMAFIAIYCNLPANRASGLAKISDTVAFFSLTKKI
jgi:hypothetical protein